MIIICDLCSGNLFKATISGEGVNNSEHEKNKPGEVRERGGRGDKGVPFSFSFFLLRFKCPHSPFSATLHYLNVSNRLQLADTI